MHSVAGNEIQHLFNMITGSGVLIYINHSNNNNNYNNNNILNLLKYIYLAKPAKR